MSTPISWPEAQRICDIPEVREALDKFAVDACEDHMLAMVSAVLTAAGLVPAGWKLVPLESNDDMRNASAEYVQWNNKWKAALAAAPQPPAVSPAVAQPVGVPSSALVLKYCELTNRHPMGTQAVSSNEGWIESTFYQVAERELQAMFTAQAALAAKDKP